MTKQQAGKLGGLTAAHRMTPQERAARARKGGNATLKARGKAHYVRMNMAKKRP